MATRNGKPFATGKTPIDNIGPRFNGFVGVKDYEADAEKTIVRKNGVSIFSGQRDDPFFADVGAIFDLVAIRKAGTTGNAGGGKDFLSGYNVHTIALQIPIAQVDTQSHTIGVWSSTERQNVTVNGALHRGWTQVSRLGEPLINEVVIPTGLKDLWNRTNPAADSQFRKYYESPILAAVLNKLYKLDVPETGRDDLVAVLGTGIPNVTFTGHHFADELRINLSIPPSAHPDRMGVLGGDNAGFPNGRRLRTTSSTSRNRQSPASSRARRSRSATASTPTTSRTWRTSPTWRHRTRATQTRKQRLVTDDDGRRACAAGPPSSPRRDTR